MVNKLVLIAPAGLMKKQDMPLISKFVQLPYVYQFLTTQPYIRPMLLSAIGRFAKSARLEQTGLDEDTTETISKITQIATYQFMHHPGFFRAFLGTVVDFPFIELTERYKKVGQEVDRSILVIWGDKDTVSCCIRDACYIVILLTISVRIIDCAFLSFSRSSRIITQG
jgi:hypothetical protein